MNRYQQQLHRLRRLIRGARLLGALQCGLAVAAILWIGFGLADALLAFESAARVAVTWVLCVLSAAVTLTLVLRALRFTEVAAADWVDRVMNDPRAPVSAGLTLEQTTTGSPLALELASRAMAQTATILAGLSIRQVLPWRPLRMSTMALVFPLAVMAVLWGLRPQVFELVATRLIHPSQDIAPYSPLVFELNPPQLQVVYGGELLVSAEITGAALEYPVECWVRRPGSLQILHLPAFRESATQFSRKLESLTEAVEVAFACNKARSKWHPVEILLEPNILSARVSIEPPAYTGMPVAAFALDTNEIAAVEGSKVTLELTSNRPLSSGELSFTPIGLLGANGEPQVLQGNIVDTQRVAYVWTATASGKLAAKLHDIRGTESARDMDLQFRCLPDLAPSVLLTSPPPALLATPSSKIPVKGTAEDDYALSKLRFVRALSGFRDRSLIVAPTLTQKVYDFETVIDLEDLGLVEGQTLELMIDASDHNPSLLGEGSSDVSRVRIISEEQYAEYVRAKTTIAQFTARFDLARDAMDQARAAVERLKQAIEKGAAIDEEIAAAMQAQQKAAETLDLLAHDFTAFEIEKRLQKLAQQQADALRANAEKLRGLQGNADKAGLQQALDEMLKGLQRDAPLAEQLQRDVATLKHAAEIMQMAARFRRIYDAQASLAKRFGSILKQLRMGDGQGRGLLPALGQNQEKNRQMLDEFKAELDRRLKELPANLEGVEALADEAKSFLDAIKQAEPETLMDAAALHGKDGRAEEAYSNAESARAVLERLLSLPNRFAEAANGKIDSLELPQQDVRKTIEQLLNSLLAQESEAAGQGEGQGAGQMGGEGMAENGEGKGFPMNVPVVGPERLQFAGESSNKQGKGQGEGGTTKPLPEAAEHGSMRADATRDGKSSTSVPDAVPEMYRDAVKQYLTP